MRVRFASEVLLFLVCFLKSGRGIVFMDFETREEQFLSRLNRAGLFNKEESPAGQIFGMTVCDCFKVP